MDIDWNEFFNRRMISFSYARMMQACVYIARRKDVVLYVGSGRSGVSRAFAVNHHVLSTLENPEEITVDVITCDSEAHCRHLEEWLIVSFKPTLNTYKPTVDSVVDRLMDEAWKAGKFDKAIELFNIESTNVRARK